MFVTTATLPHMHMKFTTYFMINFVWVNLKRLVIRLTNDQIQVFSSLTGSMNILPVPPIWLNKGFKTHIHVLYYIFHTGWLKTCLLEPVVVHYHHKMAGFYHCPSLISLALSVTGVIHFPRIFSAVKCITHSSCAMESNPIPRHPTVAFSAATPSGLVNQTIYQALCYNTEVNHFII